MEIKIISDGTSLGTKVIDAETGKELRDVQWAKWELEVGELATVELKIIGVEIEASGECVKVDAEVKK